MCESCGVRQAGHGHFGAYCELCAELPYGVSAPVEHDCFTHGCVRGDSLFCIYCGLTQDDIDEMSNPTHTCVIQETPDGMGCVTCLYT